MGHSVVKKVNNKKNIHKLDMLPMKSYSYRVNCKHYINILSVTQITEFILNIPHVRNTFSAVTFIPMIRTCRRSTVNDFDKLHVHSFYNNPFLLNK